MLSPNPSGRFSSAIEVIKMLQEISVVAPIHQPIELATSSALSIRENDFSDLFNRQTLSKMLIVRCSLHKLKFFGSLAAVLILGGYLSLKVQDLTIVAPIASNSVRVDSQYRERFSEE